MDSVWDSVVTGTPDSGRNGHRPRTRRVGKGGKLVILGCEDKVGWYLTHFKAKRTFPCTGLSCDCHRSENPLPGRWVGWILGLELPSRALCLFSITHNCYETCPALRNTNRSLKGARITLARKGEGENGRVTCLVEFEAFAAREVPVLPFTQRDVLYRVWFGEHNDLRTASQFPEARVCEKPGGDQLFPEVTE
jgi:hypothetical protein